MVIGVLFFLFALFNLVYVPSLDRQILTKVAMADK